WPSAGPELGPRVTPSPGHSWPCSRAAPTVLCCVILTEPHAWRDGDEGHDATEAAVDGKQCFVEVAGSRVGVELVEEGEGGRGKGVEGSCGQQHGQAMSVIGDRRSREQKAKQEREKELAKVTIKKEDLELIMTEMEISRAAAERSLREHMGNVVEALITLTN
uniref:Huntingtin interacting protein K n=1 Tax=Ficedula albicollis TaxID=59894 RepID=A0A803WDF0_FICAL